MTAPVSHLRVLRASAHPPAAGLYTSGFGPVPARRLIFGIATARHASTLPTSSSSSSQSSTTTAVEGPRGTTANPPPTTRPPPLTLPDRAPSTSTASHLFATGKAYLAFYKTGLKYLFANTKRVRAVDASAPDHQPLSRADHVLRHRWSHDMRRLPLFGLLLLVCGEFTPLVVMMFPHVVPYPCRIPKQVASLRREDERRRADAFKNTTPSTPLHLHLHIVRSLGLAPLRDRVGLLAAMPSLAHRITARRLRFLAADDALLRAAGGAAALEADEVVLACADRGLDVLGKDEAELRARLARWLAYTRGAEATSEPAVEEEKVVHDRIATLLTRRPEAWP